MADPITEFQGPYRWLSNFAPATVRHEGLIFSTVEHAYQASKTDDYNERRRVLACATPGDAKRMGRRVTISKDFDSTKQQVMLSLLRQKFRLPAYKRQLLQTGDAQIIEGNTWGDRYWGVCGGTGENVLGQLIMQVRAELVAEQSR